MWDVVIGIIGIILAVHFVQKMAYREGFRAGRNQGRSEMLQEELVRTAAKIGQAECDAMAAIFNHDRKRLEEKHEMAEA